jgi:hypothetical protein
MAESWNMTAAGEFAIRVFERKNLRAIFEPKKEGDLYKRKSNDDVYQLFRETDIV